MIRLVNSFVVAFQGLASAPIRSILTGLALTASVVGLTAVTAADSSVQQTIVERALLQGGRADTFVISTFQGGLAVQQVDTALANFSPLADDNRIAPTFRLDSTRLEIGSSGGDIGVIFTTHQFVNVRPLIGRAGRWIPDERPTSVARVVLNEAAASANGIRVGTPASVINANDDRRLPAIIGGVVYDGSNSPFAYVSYADAREFILRNGSDLTGAVIMTSSGSSVDLLSRRLDDISSLLELPDTLVVSRSDTVSSMISESRSVSDAFSIVGLLALLCGVLAIVNVGLSAVRERSSELILRRALGASRLFVASIMILEAAFVAVPASVLSVLVAWTLYPVVANQFASPYGVPVPPFPLESAMLGIAVGLCAGLAGCTAPVMVSLRLRAVEALRG